MQLQFGAFKKENDLSKKKHWKYFKRYEADMQLHTNGRGEPDGFNDYVNAAIANAEEKQRSSSTPAPWYPVGPIAVPNNMTGYMENGIARINCVTFHPTSPNTFFVGVAQGAYGRPLTEGVLIFLNR